MTSKHDEESSNRPLLPHHNQNVIVLPVYHHHHRPNHNYSCFISTAIVLLLLGCLIFLIFPCNPTLQVSRIHLNHIGVKSSPQLTLDLSFSLTIKVHNRDFFSLDYTSLNVSVGYRGRELGFVTSKGGKLRARASSYVNATLDVDGFEVIHDVFYLIEDFSKGIIPFDTDTRVQGKLGLFFFKVPLKGRESCEVYVNTKNQTVVRKDCHS